MRISTALPSRKLVAKCPLNVAIDFGNAHAPIIGELPDQVSDGRISRLVLVPVVEFVVVRVVFARKAFKGPG